MLKFALIALGGAIGAMVRYAIGNWVQQQAGNALPWGTLAVNVIGCALIGVLGGALLTEQSPVREEYRLFLFVGLLGAFTTFSAFGWDTVELIRADAWGRALLNVALANVAGLGAVWLGLTAARLMGSQ